MTFDCTSALSLPLSGHFSEAGIMVSGGNVMTVGVAGGISNTFQNLNNGILANSQSLVVVNSNFYNIHQQGSDDYDLMGYGIYLDGWVSPSQYTLTQIGNGSNGAVSFNNCETGIYARGASIDVSKNKMSGMTEGIVSEYGWQSIKVKENTITCTRTGIEVSQSDPLSYRQIFKNKVTLTGEGAGILLNETMAAWVKPNEGVVQQNTVNINVPSSFAEGISMTSSRRISALNNNIYLQNSTANAIGLSVHCGYATNIKENKVFGASSIFLYNSGLLGNSSPNVVWTCNESYNLARGIRFNLPCNTPENFRGNLMQHNGVGLHLSHQSTVLGTQTATGNQWTGTFSDKAARHDGGPDDISNSLFKANQTSASYWPSSIFPTTGWFGNINNIPFGCSELEEEFTGTDGGDGSIAGNNNTLYNTGRYLSERYLYRKLAEDQSLMPLGSVFESFNSQNSTTTIGKFYKVENDMATILDIDTTVQQSLDDNYGQLATATESLILTDSILAIATGQDSLDLLDDRASLLQQIDDMTQANGALITTFRNQRVSNIANVINVNDAISAPSVYEANEKAVNQVYLSVISNGQATLSANQIATLTAIADQCPADGGNGVFRARSILNSASENKVYDDEVICSAREGGQSMPLETGKWPVTLFPNPASNQINVGWQPTEGSGTVQLIDMMGKTVLSKSIDLTNGQATLHIDELSAAVYQCKIEAQGRVVFTGRLVLIK